MSDIVKFLTYGLSVINHLDKGRHGSPEAAITSSSCSPPSGKYRLDYED